MKPYYAMNTFYKPIVMDLPSGKRYAISGSTWIEVTSDVTVEMVVKEWTPIHYVKREFSQTKEYRVPSSKPGEFYVVKKENGKWSCDCTGFSYRKKCKHLQNYIQHYNENYEK
jgi:hypothetical protein